MRVKLTGLRTPEHWLGSSRSSSPQVFMRSRGINFSLCVNEATHGPQMCRGSGEGKLSHTAYSELQWPRYRAAFRVEERINKKVEQREIWMLFVMFTLRISTALWYYTVALTFRDSWLYDIFSCYNEGGRGYWHLLDRGREAAQFPQCTGQPLQQRIIQPRMSIVPRLRNCYTTFTLKDCFILVFLNIQ